MKIKLREALAKAVADALDIDASSIEVKTQPVNGPTIYIGWLFHYPVTKATDESTSTALIGLFARALAHYDLDQVGFIMRQAPELWLDALAFALIENSKASAAGVLSEETER
jgi:hypothetical protein